MGTKDYRFRGEKIQADYNAIAVFWRLTTDINTEGYIMFD